MSGLQTIESQQQRKHSTYLFALDLPSAYWVPIGGVYDDRMWSSRKNITLARVTEFDDNVERLIHERGALQPQFLGRVRDLYSGVFSARKKKLSLMNSFLKFALFLSSTCPPPTAALMQTEDGLHFDNAVQDAQVCSGHARDRHIVLMDLRLGFLSSSFHKTKMSLLLSSAAAEHYPEPAL